MAGMRFLAVLILLFWVMPPESSADQEISVKGIHIGMPVSELNRVTGSNYKCKFDALKTYVECYDFTSTWEPTIAGQRCQLNAVHAFARGLEAFNPDEFKISEAYFSCDYAELRVIGSALQKKYGPPEKEKGLNDENVYVWPKRSVPHISLYRLRSSSSAIYLSMKNPAAAADQRALLRSRQASDI